MLYPNELIIRSNQLYRHLFYTNILKNLKIVGRTGLEPVMTFLQKKCVYHRSNHCIHYTLSEITMKWCFLFFHHLPIILIKELSLYGCIVTNSALINYSAICLLNYHSFGHLSIYLTCI